MGAIRIASLLSDFLRPPHCLACGAADAWPCCAACLPPEPAGPGPWRLAADPSVTMWTLGLYGDAMRAAVLAGKFRGQSAALRALGRRLGAQLLDAGLGADLVTWVAARPARGLPRDHADQIAAGVAVALDLPPVSLLAPAGGRDLGKSRAGIRASGEQAASHHAAGHHAAGHHAAGLHAAGPQARGLWAAGDQAGGPHAPGHQSRGPQAVGVRTGGPPAAGRQAAGGASASSAGEGPIRPPPRVLRRLAGGRILLVDDVATTGSTLAGAADALYEAGARQVEVAVLGAAPTAFGPPAPPERSRRVGSRPMRRPP